MCIQSSVVCVCVQSSVSERIREVVDGAEGKRMIILWGRYGEISKGQQKFGSMITMS